VVDVPDECGHALLAIRSLGWRWPTASDGTPPAITPAEQPTLDPVGDPDQDVGSSPDPSPPELVLPAVPPIPAPPPSLDPEPESTAPVPAIDTRDVLVRMALDAGQAGLTTATATAVHGRRAYALLAALAADRRLIKAGRGRYLHPTHGIGE
jgi:hypothetical protein